MLGHSREILFAIAIIIVLSFIACKESSQPVGVRGNPRQSPLGPQIDYPFATGNQWIYLDSIINRNNVVVKYDTVTIVGTLGIVNPTWWMFNTSPNISPEYPPFPTGLSQEYDTVFGLTHSEVSYQPLTSFPIYVRAPVRGSVEFQGYSGDFPYNRTATMVPGIISTPAGVWINCIAYTSEYGTEIIKPGIGLVYYHHDPAYGCDVCPSRTVTLISYHLDLKSFQK